MKRNINKILLLIILLLLVIGRRVEAKEDNTIERYDIKITIRDDEKIHVVEKVTEIPTNPEKNTSFEVMSMDNFENYKLDPKLSCIKYELCTIEAKEDGYLYHFTPTKEIYFEYDYVLKYRSKENYRINMNPLNLIYEDDIPLIRITVNNKSKTYELENLHLFSDGVRTEISEEESYEYSGKVNRYAEIEWNLVPKEKINLIMTDEEKEPYSIELYLIGLILTILSFGMFFPQVLSKIPVKMPDRLKKTLIFTIPYLFYLLTGSNSNFSTGAVGYSGIVVISLFFLAWHIGITWDYNWVGKLFTSILFFIFSPYVLLVVGLSLNLTNIPYTIMRILTGVLLLIQYSLILFGKNDEDKKKHKKRKS